MHTPYIYRNLYKYVTSSLQQSFCDRWLWHNSAWRGVCFIFITCDATRRGFVSAKDARAHTLKTIGAVAIAHMPETAVFLCSCMNYLFSTCKLALVGTYEQWIMNAHVTYAYAASSPPLPICSLTYDATLLWRHFLLFFFWTAFVGAGRRYYVFVLSLYLTFLWFSLPSSNLWIPYIT